MFRSKSVPSKLIPRELEFAPPATRAGYESPPLSPLEEVAFLLRGLTYGDMVKLANGIGADPDRIWVWASE